MKYRSLTSDEISILKSAANTASDWQHIQVTDTFKAHLLTNNRFDGRVTIGDMTEASLSCGTFNLPVGITGCWLQDCTIGSNCAIHNVKMLSGYTIGDSCILFNIDEMTATSGDADHAWLEPMNENGGRKILPFNGMTIGDAYMWARFRGEKKMVERLEEFDDVQNVYTNMK